MIGVDEVGRGAWAGPLLVCAVRLSNPIKGLKDSKMLNRDQRRMLASKIQKSADIGYGWLSSKEVDKHGLGKALKIAALNAVQQIIIDSQEEIIIDGNVNLTPGYNVKTVIKADETVPAVSAASIVAKVARDNHMCQLADVYPDYHFHKNVGYGTSFHRSVLNQIGFCPEHRKCFKILIS